MGVRGVKDGQSSQGLTLASESEATMQAVAETLCCRIHEALLDIPALMCQSPCMQS